MFRIFSLEYFQRVLRDEKNPAIKAIYKIHAGIINKGVKTFSKN